MPVSPSREKEKALLSVEDGKVAEVRTGVDVDRHWPRGQRYKWLCALFLGQCVLYMVRAILPVCAVAIGKEFHWDKSTMGALLGSFFWGYTLTQFIGGYLADQIGGEVVIAVAAVVWGAMTILFPVISHVVVHPTYTFVTMVGARVLTGVVQGFHNPSVCSLLAIRVARNQRGFSYCVHGSGAQMGVLVAGGVGSLMLAQYGWRMPFLVIGVCGIVWGFFMRLFMMPKIPPEAERAKAEAQRTPIDWRRLLCSLSFWSLLGGHYAHSTSYFIILSWAPSYFHDNFPQATSWVFNVVPWLVAFPSSLISGFFSDWLLCRHYDLTFVRKFMETLSLVGTAIFLVLITFTDNYSLALLYVGMAIAFGSCHQAGISLNVLDVAPECGGSVFGIMNMAGSLPGFVGVYMAGFILERTHSWAAVFQQTSAICVVGWLLYMYYGTTERLV